MCWRLLKRGLARLSITVQDPRQCLSIELREAGGVLPRVGCRSAAGCQNGRLAQLSSVSQEQIFWDGDTQILEWRHGCLAQMSSLLHQGHTNSQLQPCRLVRGRTSSICKRDQ